MLTVVYMYVGLRMWSTSRVDVVRLQGTDVLENTATWNAESFKEKQRDPAVNDHAFVVEPAVFEGRDAKYKVVNMSELTLLADSLPEPLPLAHKRVENGVQVILPSFPSKDLRLKENRCKTIARIYEKIAVVTPLRMLRQRHLHKLPREKIQ